MPQNFEELEEDDIDSETMREMREMYGDQLDAGISGEDISETEETLHL